VPEGETEGALGRIGLAAAAMPLFFAVYLAAVPAYGGQPSLLFGFLLIVDIGLLAATIARGEPLAHATGGAAAMLVFAVWLAMSYVPGAWLITTSFAAAFIVLFALAPIIAERFGRPLQALAARAIHAAPLLLFVFRTARISRSHRRCRSPQRCSLMILLAWRALATGTFGLYFIAASGVAAESVVVGDAPDADHLRAALALYAAFGAYSFARPADRVAHRAPSSRAGRRRGAPSPACSCCCSAVGLHAAAALWGLAVLLAILNAGSHRDRLWIAARVVAGGALSWIVLAVWWGTPPRRRRVSVAVVPRPSSLCSAATPGFIARRATQASRRSSAS
jgi:hypothetical protein